MVTCLRFSAVNKVTKYFKENVNQIVISNKNSRDGLVYSDNFIATSESMFWLVPKNVFFLTERKKRVVSKKFYSLHIIIAHVIGVRNIPEPVYWYHSMKLTCYLFF
jgi:hypothetical protein